MANERKATRAGLRAIGVPSQLIDDTLYIAERGLDRPVPTEVLVAKTLERCRETLASMKPMADPVPLLFPRLKPAVTGEPATAAGWGALLGAFQTEVLGQGYQFATSHPDEAPIVLVDNHAVIDPTRWDADPGLYMLRGAYHTAGETLRKWSPTPICRVVVLKDTLDQYDERDLSAIRSAIASPVTACTYVVPSRRAGMFRGRSCTIVGNNIVFEMSAGEEAGSVMVTEPRGIRDPERASDVRRMVSGLGKSALAIYPGAELDPRFKYALESTSNERLREVLAGVMNSQV